jgi:integrase/recombinase XerD
MSTIVSLILDRRSEKKDGTQPLCLMLNFKKKRSYINLGRSVASRYWSQESERITKGANVKPSPGSWNDFLQGKLNEAQAIVNLASEQGILDQLTHEELKQRIQKGPIAPQSFSVYLDGLIEEFKRNGKDGQARIYTMTKSFLKKYGDKPTDDYLFEDINYRLLRLIEGRYTPRIEGNMNGLSIPLRTIRAVWNRAIKEGVTTQDKYPFKQYTIKKSKTHKTAISIQDFDKIAGLQLPVDTPGWHNRNMFFFSYYCRGMNFYDIAMLKWSNIQAGRITYVRKKVGKQISIKINEDIQHILDLYPKKDADENDYIFPVIVQSTKSASYQALRYISGINHSLKRWAKTLDLDPTLSFNTARHSWATIGRNMELPIAVISQGLGHSDVETTQIYLDEFDTGTMDNANDLVSQKLKRPGG